jgi:DNA invertase Pin-like site-specific DNA recombinase
MSSDRQELSLSQQEAELRRLCDRKAYRVAAVYRDEGISGDNFERRKGFRQMLDDASKGIFVRVLAWDQDRIGRHDSLTSGAVLTPLRKSGIAIETIAQGELDLESFAGRVTFTVQQEAKHQFLRDLSRNIVRGQAAKAEAGEGYYGTPFNYGYTRETKLIGNRRFARLLINEPEAAIVRRIFAEYLKPDSSFAKVADSLNADKVRPPRQRKFWEPDTVRYMVRNPIFTGRMVYGRKPSGKYSRRTAEGIVSIRPGQAVKVAEPIVRKVPDIVPPLIDDVTFEKAQKLIAERRLCTRRTGTIRPLSGLIICGKCGRRYHGEGGSYLCSTSRSSKKPDRCSARRVREAPIVAVIDELVQKHLGTPAVAAALRRKIEARLAAAKTDAAADEPAKQKRLQSLERQLRDGAARLLEVPPGLVPELAKALEAVREERDTLASQIEANGKSRPAEPTPKAIVDQMMSLVSDLKKASQKGDAALINHCFRRLGVEIVIRRNDRTAAEATVRLLSIGDSTESLKYGSCR